jgi:putative endonuclease
VRHGRGEIDIIAERQGVFAVCEVKTRRNDEYGFAAEAMTPAKIRTVRRTAFGWARDNGVLTSRMRFDAAFVVGASMDVVENAY